MLSLALLLCGLAWGIEPAEAPEPSAGAAIPIDLSQTRPSELAHREIRFVVPRAEYREDFAAGRNHPAGTYLYFDSVKPDRDRIAMPYRFESTEFRFTRPDGRADVVLIETSPQVSGRWSAGLFLRARGEEYVTLAYACSDDRTCEERYTATLFYMPEVAETLVSGGDDFNGDIGRLVRRILAAGRRQHRGMRRLMLAEIRTTDRRLVLADQITTTLPENSSGLKPATLHRIARLVRRLHAHAARHPSPEDP